MEPGNDGTGYLLFDGNARTGLNVKNGTSISFMASEQIRSLYLVWDTPHEQWDFVLSQNGEETRKAYGENGFFHEYADLGDSYDIVTLAFNGKDSILCDIYAFSEGDVPDWVQIWRAPLEKADLLVLPARAGDEFLYFGGTIPYYLERGKSVQVAYMTNLFDEPLKTHEVLTALYTSGLRVYPVISAFPEMTAASVDSALESYDEYEVLSFVTRLLRRFKPGVVVGQGEYGDGVQMLSASALMIAAELSGDAFEYGESADEFGVWNVPKVYLHSNSASDDESETKIDWGSSLSIAEQAFSHYSWRKNRKIETEGTYDSRRFLLYRTTVGADTGKNDFFENIGMTNSQEPKAGAEPESAREAVPALPEAAPGRLPSIGGSLAQKSSLSWAMPLTAVLMIIAAMIIQRRKD